MKLKPQPLPICQNQLLLWAWAIILLRLSSFVSSLDLLIADKPPRAALVALAHDHDLPGMLHSIRQLEDQFNSRYQYHWVFFSSRELSEEFKQLTSNATNATCIYEVIPNEHWSVPDWIDRSRLQSLESVSSTLDQSQSIETTNPDIRQIYRWHSGPFAKEKRLRDYDWFLRVKPGVQFTRDINFDVFRFMRDRGIAYGFDKAVLEETNLRELSPRIRSFINKNPDLLHEEADVSWLLGTHDSDGTLDDVADNEEELELRDETKTPHAIVEGNPKRASHSRADWPQIENSDDDDGDDEDSGSLAEAFTSWLSGIYESNLYPTIEIGSLAFFRSPNHLALFDHLDSAGDFYYRRVEDVPIHTLSASMFLPRQSVWSFRRRETRHRQPRRPEPTPDPDFNLHGVEADPGNSMTAQDDVKEAMEARLAQWELLALDLERQEGIPGLMSGNTVIDERNFALT